MGWVYLAVAIVVTVVAVVLSPKPPDATPPSLEEFDIPTAEPGREIPKIWGRRRIKSPNIVWYGDIAYAEVKS